MIRNDNGVGLGRIRSFPTHLISNRDERHRQEEKNIRRSLDIERTTTGQDRLTHKNQHRLIFRPILSFILYYHFSIEKNLDYA